jgi:hydroxymethylbilane synthase
MTNKLRIATRTSKLALWQANYVKTQLQQHYSQLAIELIHITTSGDKNTELPLNQIGGKALFVKELQRALLENKADIAVHSIKDMSVYPHQDLMLAAVCEREDARDVFIANQFNSVDDLAKNAVVGTASPRRQSLLLNKRPDLKIKLLRGNVPTRLQKCLNGDYDAIILAAAGIKRLNLTQHIKSYLPLHDFIPAIGQGAMGIECRRCDKDMVNLLATINHPPSQICVIAERAVNQVLGGDCHTPVGAHAIIENKKLYLNAFVGSLDGSKTLTSSQNDDIQQAQQLGEKVGQDLLNQGAKELL